MAKPSLAKRCRHLVEGVSARLLFALFGLLPLAVASAIGGFLGRLIGPGLKVSERAADNLRQAFPERSPAEIRHLVRRMWANLGRVAAEYPHIKDFHCYRDGGRIEVIGTEILDEAKRSNSGGIFFTGHLGNWEVSGLSVTQYGIPLALVYRSLNNPLVDRLIDKARIPITDTRVPKGPTGAREIVKFLRGGGFLGMLVDQKMNDGIPVPFFGREAMTAPAVAELAIKYDCPAYPARVERRNGAHFRITMFPKLEVARTGDRAADVAETMRRINALLEGWIRERPEQWLWLHRRWPK